MKACEELVRIPAGTVVLEGTLVLPAAAVGLVLFAHGSGSSRHSPRNNFVARVLNERGLGTVLMDLLTAVEDEVYATRFDIRLLAERLTQATAWMRGQPWSNGLPIGYFGASTGAAAALIAAAAPGAAITAVVSRGGRPDLAGDALEQVQAPVLLIVGGNDFGVIELNEEAYARLGGPKELAVVAGASHLFDEQGTLAEAAGLAADWLEKYLGKDQQR
jgi:putative phosphoribosyl transferase